MKTTTVKIVGTTSLLMHNSNAGNPLSEFNQRMAALHQQKKKKGSNSFDIMRQLADLELEAGLYHDPKDGPIVPAHVIEACIRSGAKLVRKGTDVVRAVQMQGSHVPLDYEGPRSVKDLVADPRFRDQRMVRVGPSRVLRTRPKFSTPWSCRVTLMVDEARVTTDEAVAFLRDGGQFEGIGDGRGLHFGRFTVV